MRLAAVSAPDDDRHQLRIARPAVYALTQYLPEKIAHATYSFITGPLLDDPRRVGKPLNSPFAPAYSARRGEYRILYEIDDATRTVEVTAIGHRSSACRPREPCHGSHAPQGSFNSIQWAADHTIRTGHVSSRARRFSPSIHF